MSDGQILRTGVLFKKGSGSGPFGRKNWKPRYFVLTPLRLQYFTFEDGELKGELSLQGCDEGVLEVMPADSMKTGSSASTIWRVAINAPERRLLVAASTEMEMNDWVDKLVLAFRINSGQPTQRASMPASVASVDSVASNPSIKDFQNFSVPRRGLNQRHSMGADMRPSMGEQEMQLQHAQAESIRQQQLDEQRRLEDEQSQEEQLRQQDEQQHRQVEQDAEMRRQLAAQQEEEEAAHAAALAAAEALQWQEEQQKQAQKERELLQLQQAAEQEQQQAAEQEKERELQQAVELQRAREAEEAARLQHEQEQEQLRNQRLAQELAMQEQLKPQQGEDLLELQRRQKREEHARQRAEREQAVQAKLQQEQAKLQQEQEDLAFRMTQQMNSHFSVDDDSDDSDHEPEGSPMTGAGSSPVVGSGPIGSGGLDEQDAARLSASAAAAPRSSLVGDVKREMIQKQQLEHQRRREAALQQEQQARDAEWRQQQAALEASNGREAPREVQVAPREIEVVRRAPVKKPAAAPMESFEF